MKYQPNLYLFGGPLRSTVDLGFMYRALKHMATETMDMMNSMIPAISNREFHARVVFIWMKAILFISLSDRISTYTWHKLSGNVKYRSQNKDIPNTGKGFATGNLPRLCN